MWEENSGFILVSNSGYYEICFGFFSMKKPNIQVMINGELAVSAVNNAAYIVQNNSGKLKNQGVAGISLQEYLNIPSRARISIVINGAPGEGFISLRKL